MPDLLKKPFASKYKYISEDVPRNMFKQVVAEKRWGRLVTNQLFAVHGDKSVPQLHQLCHMPPRPEIGSAARAVLRRSTIMPELQVRFRVEKYDLARYSAIRVAVGFSSPTTFLRQRQFYTKERSRTNERENAGISLL